MSRTEKAFLEIEGSADTIPCMFNPAELSVSRSNYLGRHIPCRAGRSAGQVSRRAVRDDDAAPDVRHHRHRRGGHQAHRQGAEADGRRPVAARAPTRRPTTPGRPTWSSTGATCIRSRPSSADLNLQFTYFSSTGVPLRAKVDLSLTQFAESDAFGPQNPTSGTPEPHRVHRVQPGETLDRISAKYYGDSTRWRAIATANGIADPLALRTGSLLQHPQGRVDDRRARPSIAPGRSRSTGSAAGELRAGSARRPADLPRAAPARPGGAAVLRHRVRRSRPARLRASAPRSRSARPTAPVLFLGEVTGVELQLDRGQPEFTVVADDLAYKMTLGTKVRTFTKVTYAEVISQIAREHGLQRAGDRRTDAAAGLPMQADSDFGFLTEIADRTGNDWWMDGTHAGTSSRPRPTGTAVTADGRRGPDTRSPSGPARCTRRRRPSAAGGRQTKQSVTGDGRGTRPAGVRRPTWCSRYLTASDLKQRRATTISTADMPGDQTEAEAWPTGWSTGGRRAPSPRRARCPADPRSRPAARSTIAGAGPASGTYHVTEVEHTYTGAASKPVSPQGIGARPAWSTCCRASAPSSFRRDGLVIGIVTKVGNSAGLAGEVKVKYTSLGDQVESNWARVVTLGAGRRRGVTFLPEINDEVIVGFEGGDARRPVDARRAVYNGRDVPAEFGVQNNTVSASAGSPPGSGISSNSATAPTRPTSTSSCNLAGGKHQVRLGKDKLDRDGAGRHPGDRSSPADSSIEIGQDGSITIPGKKITLKSETDVEISGVNITPKASVKAAISGDPGRGQGVGDRRGLGRRRDDHQGRHGGGQLMDEMQSRLPRGSTRTGPATTRRSSGAASSGRCRSTTPARSG